MAIQYTYSDELLGAADEEWHLVDDNTTSIDVFKIDNNIQKGAIILQKSMDHMNWYNVSVQSNAFKNTPVQNGVLYETTDIEMINGCYYRLVVVYELAQKVGTSTVALVIPKDEIEYKRIAEVYEFYVVDKNEHIERWHQIQSAILLEKLFSFQTSQAILERKRSVRETYTMVGNSETFLSAVLQAQLALKTR